MSSSKQAESTTIPGVQLQIANDFSSGGAPQQVTDPQGNPSALQLSQTTAIIGGSGQLGIGMSPTNPLHVAYNNNVRFEMGPLAWFSLGAPGVVNVDAVDITGGRFTIQSNGNVGIGQPNPQYTLDVAGTIHASGLVVQGLPNTANAPPTANLMQLYVDTVTGQFYCLSKD